MKSFCCLLAIHKVTISFWHEIIFHNQPVAAFFFFPTRFPIPFFVSHNKLSDFYVFEKLINYPTFPILVPTDFDFDELTEKAPKV